MSPVIERLILQIAYVCLHITAQGKWHAHLAIQSHVNAIDVYLLPANTDYHSDDRPERAYSQAVYYHDTPGYDWEKPEQQEARIGAELLAMLADLEPFLGPEGAEVAA